MDRYLNAIAILLLMGSGTFGQSIMGAGHRKVGAGGATPTVTFLNKNTMQQITANSVTDTTHMSVNSGGSNKVAFAVVLFDGSGAAISSVSYGGNSMTSCGSPANNSALNINAQVFALDSPPSGLNTLVITGNGSVAELYYNLVAFTGADTTLACPVRSGTYQTDGTHVFDPSPATLTITSDAHDLTLTALEITVPVSGTNQTSDGTNAAGTFAAASDHATTGAASVTHNWTFTGNSTWAIVGFSIKHA